MRNLIIDYFAGGGGASVGIEMALGRSVDIAINHDPMAIAMHRKNHPSTFHYTEDVMNVNIRKKIRPDDRVRLIWASPDCTQHSRAKGGKPVEKGLRVLPYGVRRGCLQIREVTGHLPDVIIMENVAEIQDWGPVDEHNKPIKEKKGEDYKKFINSMKMLGYEFECRELVAADYGAPTIRKRWYAIFRCDGKPITWPKPTHSKTGSDGLKPWVPVSEVLDFADIGKSIFGRKKPLAVNTMRRIAMGLEKFAPQRYMVQVNHGGDTFRGQELNKIMPTITSKHGFGLVMPFVTKFYKSGWGQQIFEPLHTITTSPGHFGLISVYAVPKEHLYSYLKRESDKTETNAIIQKCTEVSQFIIEYYGQGVGQRISEPLHTIVTKDRFALITVLRDEYVILDIFLRMLKPEELKLAQGFPKDYIIDFRINGRPYPINEQVARIGNSVVPIVAQRLVESNVGYLKVGERMPNLQIASEPTGQLRFA